MERDVSSATSVNFIPNGGGLEQNSTGDSITSGSSSPLRSNEKVQSRYLSSHMASCHDLCKYGKKNDSEAEARHLNFRKFREKNLVRDGERNQVTILVPGERRIRTATKPKATSKVENEFPDYIEGPKPQTPQPLKNNIASVEKKTFQTSLENEQSQAKSLNPGDGKKVKKIIGETSPVLLQYKPSPNQPNATKFKDLSPASDMDASEKPNIIKKKRNPSVKKPISPVVPEVIQQKALPSVTEGQKTKQMVPLSPKIVDVAGKSAISLKAKTPLIRSISQLRSSRSAILRRNQENKIMRSLGTTKTGERELLKPSTDSFSPKSLGNLIARRNQDNKVAKSLTTSKIGERKFLKPTPVPFPSKTSHESASSLQPRKLRSIKRASTPHDSVFSLRPRNLRSIKQTSTHGSVSSLQPRKLGSIKLNSTNQDNVLSLQPRKQRSVKRISTPHENVSSSQPRKLWNVKLTSTPPNSAYSFQPRKLRSVMLSSSVKDKDKVGKANNIDSKSGNNDSDPILKIEESESATSGVSDEEIEGNNKVEVSKDDEKKRSRRTAATRPEDDTSTPFKLKFRRGKVINLRSESIGTRRLWFNIGMLNGDNLNGNGLLGRRSFRRKRDNASLDSNDPDSEVQSVVLKHQDATEKKDAKSLFNHVIEETASKLVETRKSKVKALVGAFETVISLQETKPTPAV